MKNFKKKFLVKLIVLVCIVTSLLGLGPNNRVHADSSEDKVYGSVLITPITQLLTGLGDGAMDLIHKTVLEQDETIIRLDDNADSWWNKHGASVLGWILGIGICVAIMFLTLGGGGIAAIGLAGKAAGVSFVIKTVASSLVWGTVVGTSVTAVATIVDATMLGDDLYLPVFNLTPEQIFSNKVWLFDVNFFEPDDEKKFTLQKDAEEITVSKIDTKNGGSAKYENVHTEAKKIETDKGGIITIAEAQTMPGLKELIADVNTKLAEVGDPLKPIQDSVHKLKVIDTDTYNTPAAGMEYNGAVDYEVTRSETEIYIIYKNNPNNTSEYLSIKCISSTNNSNRVKETVIAQPLEKQIEEKTSIATELKGVISEWYYTLRNLAVILLLLLLIYSGIRIVTGSTAGEKAKHKERIIDWGVSICLIFMMHYIMVFAVELNDKFVEMVDASNGIKGVDKIINLNTNNHLNLATKDARLNDFIRDGGELGVTPGTKYLEWPTDIMGGFRIEQQKVNEGTANWIGYSICYLVLVVYTVIFTWTYLRRVLYMAFLTMIAPLVAMTYSLDKITDGKAQAFNAWIREYIFNLLIQPFHLMLYTVLITSSYELAGDNALYAAVAIGFMTPAEKLLRKFFGFEKAQTPGALGGAAGAALAMGGLQKLISFGSKESNASQEEEENKEIKYSRADGVSAKTTVAESELSDLEDIRGNSSVEVNTGRMSQGGSRVTFQPGTEQQNIRTAGQQDTITVSSREENAGNTTIDGVNAPANVVAGRTAGTQENVQVSRGSASAANGGDVQTANTGSGNNKDIVLEGTSNAKKKKRRLRAIRATGTGIAAYTRALGRKNYKRMKKSRPIRSLLRGAAGLYGGTAMGLAGLVLGIASGDPSKAFQYTTTGALGGWSVGKGLAGRAVDTFSVDTNKIKQEMSLSYHGKDYKYHQLEKQKKELARDEESIMYLRKTLGVSRAEAIRILKTTGADCLDNGIEDIEDIATQHQYKIDNVQSTLEDMANQEVDSELMRRIGDTYQGVTLTDQELKQIEKQTNQELEPEIKAIEEEEEKLNKGLEKEAYNATKSELDRIRNGEEPESEEAKKAKAEIERINRDKSERIKQIDRDYNKKLQNAQDEVEKERLEREAEQQKQVVYAEADRQREIAKEELKKDIKKRLESDAQSKLGKRKAELEQKKIEFEQKKVDKIEAMKKQMQIEKRKTEEREKNWYKRFVAEKKREAEKAIKDKDELYEKALKKTFEQGVTFKKFSSRTPDFNKLGEDKIDSYRRLFAKEMYDEMVKVLKGKGYSEKDAIRFAEKRSQKAAQAIIDGVKNIDKVQSGLTEVSDE